jgi:hypothetical protein
MAVIGFDACLYSLFQQYRNSASVHILILDGVVAISGIFSTYYFPEERPALIGFRARIWCALEHIVLSMLPISWLLLAVGATALMVSYSIPLACALGAFCFCIVLLCVLICCLALPAKASICSEARIVEEV